MTKNAWGAVACLVLFAVFALPDLLWHWMESRRARRGKVDE